MSDRTQFPKHGMMNGQRQRGIAMLTVLAVLTVFAIFATALIQTIRIEIGSSASFKYGQIVRPGAEAGIKLLKEIIFYQFFGPDKSPNTLDDPYQYLSLSDAWAMGQEGSFSLEDTTLQYEALRWRFSSTQTTGTQLIEPRLKVQNGMIYELRFWNPTDLNDPQNGKLFINPGSSNHNDLLPFYTKTGIDEDPLDGSDNDEDGLTDEDEFDLLPLVNLSPRVKAMGLGWDADDDQTGVSANSSKLNINIAGNLNGPGASHSFHQGIHPSELDLEVFLNLFIGSSGKDIAKQLILLRNGADRLPGVAGADDNRNNSYNILGSKLDFQKTFKGNDSDDDGDGLTDEEDEVYVGITDFENEIPGDLKDNRGNKAQILTNGVDDGGIVGVIDDLFEIDQDGDGFDELAETNPSKPYGDDTPLLRGSVSKIIRRTVEVALGQQQADLLEPILESLEDNLVYTSTTPSERQENTLSQSGLFQTLNSLLAQPGVRRRINPNLILAQIPEKSRQPISYLYSLLGIDNDGDWNLSGDDWNKNQIPDGDWDGWVNLSDASAGGDANQDTLTSYDPEGHIDEDIVKIIGVERVDDDRTTKVLIENDKKLRYDEDRLDNNNNRIRWLSDGIDNDGDGLTDETWQDEVQNGTPQIDAKDEGVDEPGEWYVKDWDDDDPKDSRFDEDLPEVQLVANLADALDFSISSTKFDGVNKISIPLGKVEPNKPEKRLEAMGLESVRITEVLARPVIRLQAEDAVFKSNGSDWFLDDRSGAGNAKGYHYLNNNIVTGQPAATWTFKNIPSGKYYILVYSYHAEDPIENRYYHLDDTIIRAGKGSGSFVTLINTSNTSTLQEILFTSETIRERFFPSRPRAAYSLNPVLLDDAEGQLVVEITKTGTEKATSFDYVELYAPDAQFLELANFGEQPLNLAYWEIRTGNSNLSILPAEKRDPKEDPILYPGQIAVIYRADLKAEDLLDPDKKEEAPSGITLLKPRNYYQDGQEVTRPPLVLTAKDVLEGTKEVIVNGETKKVYYSPLQLSSSLDQILFVDRFHTIPVEIWAPEDSTQKVDEVKDNLPKNFVLIDCFNYHLTVDYGSRKDAEKRQDRLPFSAEQRGDPTLSLLKTELTRIDQEDILLRSYVHGPFRFRAEDAVVTFKKKATIDPKDVEEAMDFKARAYCGYGLSEDEIESASYINPATSGMAYTSEFGDPLFEFGKWITDTDVEGNFKDTFKPAEGITFHWPGLLNHFRDPYTGKLPPRLYIRVFGIPKNKDEERVHVAYFDMDPKDDEDSILGKELPLTSGDLIYSITTTDENKLDDDYGDILDLNTNSLRLTFYLSKPVKDMNDDAETTLKEGYFSHIEVVGGYEEGKTALIACNPGMDFQFYPYPEGTALADDGGENGQSFLMQRIRNRSGAKEVSLRSLRFREGPLANCSAYMTGPSGINLERYSMGRGLFAGPTPYEFMQIANAMEFLGNPQADGLVNVNLADQKVLAALPFFPPESASFQDIDRRTEFAALMSQVLVMGRSQRGLDGELGLLGVDDDLDGQADFDDIGNPPTQIPQYSWFRTWDCQMNQYDPPRIGFGVFGVDDDGDGVTDEPDEYQYPGTDDGPYRQTGQIALSLLNPLVADYVRFINENNSPYNLNGQLKQVAIDVNGGNLRTIDETDLMILMGRVSNLITVQSNEFNIICRGKLIDSTLYAELLKKYQEQGLSLDEAMKRAEDESFVAQRRIQEEHRGKRSY